MALQESGAGGFVRLVEDGDYVDKSMLIADILGMNDRGVYLFTRPRGFGKSVNISMLDAFFNIGYEGNRWFDGLEISEHHEFDGYRNKFPVIHLDLKDVVPTPKESDYAGFLKMIRLAIQESCEPFRHLLYSDNLYADEERTFSSILDGTVDGVLIPQTLRRVCRIIERVHGRKVVVLIDGYDRAVTDSLGTDLQADIICFLGDLMSAILKSNSALQMGYVTGVMQVAKAGMFSGLNNLDVNDVFSRDSDERFGFTEDEVKGILEHYGHSEKMSEVKDWYDGYRFGDAEVYNPYSVMRYVRNGFLSVAYWSLSGNDAPIRWMLDRSNRGSFDAVANIVGGTSVETDIHPDMTYDDLRRSRGTDLFSLMVMTGYLKAVPSEDGFKVSVPNTEVMGAIGRILEDHIMLHIRGPVIE